MEFGRWSVGIPPFFLNMSVWVKLELKVSFLVVKPLGAFAVIILWSGKAIMRERLYILLKLSLEVIENELNGEVDDEECQYMSHNFRILRL